MIHLALLPLLALSSATEDPTPVGPAIIELMIADPSIGDDLCNAYTAVVSAIDAMDLDYEASKTFMDASDAYLIVSIEGDQFRLDNEARDTLTDWLHGDCMS